VLTLSDTEGRELAYADDDRFNPDPTILFEVPRDGDYVVAIRDSLYRGREDFVYRLTLGELPFLTGLFPLGGRLGAPPTIQPAGWNLEGTELAPPPAAETGPAIEWLAATRRGLRSNRLPFAWDTLPETGETNPNHDAAHAQAVTLPVIINGRIERSGDWDVFAFAGASNSVIVAEVQARQLDSPLDSIIKLTDPDGAVLAFNDDHEDLASGSNTHQADSFLMATLPANGTYCLHLGDTARHGGHAYAYRLRLGTPRPDFALRVTPSSASLKTRSTAALTVYALRRDGFASPITVALKDPPAELSAPPITLAATQTVARLTIKSGPHATEHPLDLTIVGHARIVDREVTREAVPAEDKMQAFLWRHLLPARDLPVLVFDPEAQPSPRQVARAQAQRPLLTNAVAAPPPVRVPGATNAAAAATPDKPKFTRQQIAGRLRQLRLLFEEGLLTHDFYEAKLAECEAAP